MNYEGPGSQIAVMERAMRISDDVIRYLTTKQPATPVEMPAAVELPEVEVAEPA
jgi:small subunit ribosomal protein S6